MASPELIAKAEYLDLQRRYLGLDWPENQVGGMPLDSVSERMGVGIAELRSDVEALRQQKRTFSEAQDFRQNVMQEQTLAGFKGILFFLMMLGMCFVLFGVLVYSVRVFVPQGRNLQAKPPAERSYSDGVEIVPQPQR